MLKRFLVRDVKYDKKSGRRIGKYTEVFAHSEEESVKRFAAKKRGGRWTDREVVGV